MRIRTLWYKVPLSEAQPFLSLKLQENPGRITNASHACVETHTDMSPEVLSPLYYHLVALSPS